jgi:hypothetical protein
MKLNKILYFSAMSGSNFEKKCISLITNNCFIIREKNVSKGYFLKQKNLEFTLLFKSWFWIFFNKHSILKPHGCRQPDMAFLIGNVIFVLEFKYQSQNGSSAEKLQTGKLKQNFYLSILPQYRIFFIYILSSWFELNCLWELDYLKKENICYFFSGNDWVTELITFIKTNA